MRLKILLLILVICDLGYCQTDTAQGVDRNIIQFKVAPVEVEWAELYFDVEEVWSEKEQAYYRVPKWTDRLKELEGKEIQIKGYITCFDIKTNYYVLSKENKNSANCQLFESRVVIDISSVRFIKKKKINENKEVIIKGILRLNSDDIYSLNLLLESAKITGKNE